MAVEINPLFIAERKTSSLSSPPVINGWDQSRISCDPPSRHLIQLRPAEQWLLPTKHSADVLCFVTASSPGVKEQDRISGGNRQHGLHQVNASSFTPVLPLPLHPVCHHHQLASLSFVVQSFHSHSSCYSTDPLLPGTPMPLPVLLAQWLQCFLRAINLCFSFWWGRIEPNCRLNGRIVTFPRAITLCNQYFMQNGIKARSVTYCVAGVVNHLIFEEALLYDTPLIMHGQAQLED